MVRSARSWWIVNELPQEIGNSAIYIQSENRGFRQVLETFDGAVAQIYWKLAEPITFAPHPSYPNLLRNVYKILTTLAVICE
jgi:hypothetical protein